MTQPMRNWIRMNRALASLVAGDGNEAARRFGEIDRKFNDLLGNYSLEETKTGAGEFSVEASKQLVHTP